MANMERKGQILNIVLEIFLVLLLLLLTVLQLCLAVIGIPLLFMMNVSFLICLAMLQFRQRA